MYGLPVSEGRSYSLRMTPPALDDVLRRVAAGQLTPEAALATLDDLRRTTPSETGEGGEGLDTQQGPDDADLPTPPAGAATSLVGGPDSIEDEELGVAEPESAGGPWVEPAPVGSARRSREEGASGGGTAVDPFARAVKVVVSYCSAHIIADPTVRDVSVSGSHTITRQGDLIVVQSPDVPPLFTQDAAGAARFAMTTMPQTMAWAKAWKDHHMLVRFNPHRPLVVELSGGSARIGGGEAGVRISARAGSVRLEQVRGPLEIDAASSSVRGTVQPEGSCSLKADSAAVRLGLLPGTDLLVHATYRMGKVVLPGPQTRIDPDTVETVLGAGRGRWDIDAVMSSVVLAEVRR